LLLYTINFVPVALRKVGLAVYEVEDSDQFSGTIESVQGKLEEQAVARKEQLTENEDLRKKLLGLLAQFDQQQGAFDQQLKYVCHFEEGGGLRHARKPCATSNKALLKTRRRPHELTSESISFHERTMKCERE